MAEYKQITKMAGAVRILAPAKLNLSLLVAGKRPDGFHEIETIMAKINLFDELTIEHGDKEGIELICTGPQWAPQGSDNLVYKTCESFLERANKKENLKITLSKNIPAGAGLASASTDAAAVLIGLNEFLSTGFSKDELSELAARLGSDVAFFLGGPLSVCTGKGEKVREINRNFNFNAILILPKISCSTKRVYENYKHDEQRFWALKRKIDSLIEKNRIDLVVKMCANMLDLVCFDLYRELAELKTQLESLYVKPLCLSGSGSAMYYYIEES
ncbi:MAG: 4-(cytidine 5'-diphospho)-2-C-methyl-D-erythritol kinase, partial [Phycisphaerae bacterium]